MNGTYSMPERVADAIVHACGVIAAVAATAVLLTRITSYNVCYTKLLRLGLAGEAAAGAALMVIENLDFEHRRRCEAVFALHHLDHAAPTAALAAPINDTGFDVVSYNFV